MNSEETIAAFLQVWDNNSELLQSSATEADLDNLNQTIISSPGANEEIAKEIREWCKKYPDIRDAVRTANRKPKPKSSQSAPAVNALDNRYPELSKILRSRIQNDQQSDG